MALIDFKSPTQPYMVFTCAPAQDFGATLTAFFNLASTVTASSDIIKTSNTRLTFSVSGVYEFEFTAYGIKNTSAAGTISHQYGINGSFVTFTTTSAAGIAIVGGIHSLIFQVNAGDYFEMRQVLTGGTPSQNVTGLGRYINSNYISRICDVID